MKKVQLAIRCLHPLIRLPLPSILGWACPNWQPLHVPSESLEMFAAFQADSDHVSLQVRSGACNVAALMCASPSMLKFLTPSGVSVVLSMYRDGQ